MKTGRVVPPILLILLLSLALAGCGKKSKTSLTYVPHGVPVAIKCSRQADGLWTLSGGLITHVGIFSIEQSFDTRDEFTYLVLRDRAKGTDQVFKLATKGYVKLHTVGEHRIQVERDDNKVVIDVETVSGAFGFDVFPDSEAVARVEFGSGQPDFVLFSDRRLAVEYQSYIWSDDSLPLDSVQSITYRKSFGSRALVFDWKPAAKDHPEPFQVNLTDRLTAEQNFSALQRALAQAAPHVQFKRSTDTQFVAAVWAALAGSGLFTLAMVAAAVYSFRVNGKVGWGCVGLYFTFCSALGCFVLLLILSFDWEVASGVFA